MPYNELLAERVRRSLGGESIVEEKKMMGGLCFMVNDKMALGILKDDLMVRIDPAAYEDALERRGCREMDFTGKAMRGFVFVGPDGTDHYRDLNYWVQMALEFNAKAKPSRKKKLGSS